MCHAAQLMNVEGLTRENVASHLQKYRILLKRHAHLPVNAPLTPDNVRKLEVVQQVGCSRVQAAVSRNDACRGALLFASRGAQRGGGS
jgi:hypothetical protein